MFSRLCLAGYRKKSAVALDLGWHSASALHLILGGAALQRCDNRIVLNAALAAEVAVLAPRKTLSAAYKAAETGLAPSETRPAAPLRNPPDQIF